MLSNNFPFEAITKDIRLTQSSAKIGSVVQITRTPPLCPVARAVMRTQSACLRLAPSVTRYFSVMAALAKGASKLFPIAFNISTKRAVLWNSSYQLQRYFHITRKVLAGKRPQSSPCGL